MAPSEVPDVQGLDEVVASLLMGSGVGVALLDSSLRVRWLSESLVTLVDRSLGEPRGRALAELLPAFSTALAPSLSELAQGRDERLQRELEIVCAQTRRHARRGQ
jgi:hypothetical protein